MRRIISAVYILLSVFVSVQAQEKTYNLDEIVVSAANTPVFFKDLARNVIVINAKQLQQLPVNDLNDLLAYAVGIDNRSRGVNGVQADIGLRGGSFEQTLILVDGMKMSDPQTGHHNMNLPVPIEAIEKIEILKGQGSNIYGPNAFSGAINFITKKETETNFAAKVLGGSYGYGEVGFNFNLPVSGLGNSVSLNKKRSDGYRHNTDFDNTTISYSMNYSLNRKSKLHLLLGYNDKDFGANSFYTDAFPNQREHTTTKFAGLTFRHHIGLYNIESKLYYRNHKDEFWLNSQNPAFYYNNHKSDSYNFEINTSTKNQFGNFYLGGEFGIDKINSSNLGNRERNKFGVFIEQSAKFGKTNIIVGAFAYKFGEIGWRYWPNLDISHFVSSNLKLFVTGGMAFRIPTFTELYYSDPRTQGNSQLAHEETLNFEFGSTYSSNGFMLSGSLFSKFGKNLIDYVKNESSGKWEAQNIAEINVNGFEVSIFTPLKPLSGIFESIKIDYSFLDANKETKQLDSRYAFNFMKHQLIVNLAHYLPFGITSNWIFRFEERPGQTNRFLTDIKMKKQIEKFNVFISAVNLFNEEYFDISGVILPGTWVKAGVDFSF